MIAIAIGPQERTLIGQTKNAEDTFFETHERTVR